MKRLLALLAALGGCSSAPLQSDWEREHLAQTAREDVIAPPSYPRAAQLVAIDVPAPADFQFFVDGTTVSVGQDRIVRYVLVGRSASGAENVTFEGMRCDSREYRIYAVGHRGDTWSGTPTPWRSLRDSDVAPVRRALQRNYFCADAMPVRDTASAAAALRSPRRSSGAGD